uniref:Uncharacterized protein n=1 Tax=Lygus hesperus TaxID=30085 RepID=A0A146L2N8_LYGHE
MQMEDHAHRSFPGDQSLYYRSIHPKNTNGSDAKRTLVTTTTASGTTTMQASVTAPTIQSQQITKPSSTLSMATNFVTVTPKPEKIATTPVSMHVRDIIRQLQRSLHKQLSHQSRFPGSCIAAVRTALHDVCPTQDRDDCINTQELHFALTSCGLKVTEDECKVLLRNCKHTNAATNTTTITTTISCKPSETCMLANI